MSATGIKILIVDDHAIVRKGLVLVLRLEDDFEVVGEAGNIVEAIAIIRKTPPDIILLDRLIPNTEVKENIGILKSAAPDARLLMLTGTELDTVVLEILRLGVDGYVMKEIEPQELKQAIRIVARGDAYLQPVVTRHVIDAIAKQDKVSDLLTPREIEVLEWMKTTATYREIARQLTVSEETIRSHAKHILSKLGQTNRAAAVQEAVRMGLISA